MNYKDIQLMTREKYMDEYSKYIWNDFDFATNIKRGHAYEFHCNKTDIEIISRMITDDKKANSSFINEYEMTEAIQITLMSLRS